MKNIKDTKEQKTEYKIIPIFATDGDTIETVIQNAFLKYLKFNDYK